MKVTMAALAARRRSKRTKNQTVIVPGVRSCRKGRAHSKHGIQDLCNHRYSDLLTNLDFIWVRNIARGGNIRIVIGRPIEAVADL